MMWSKTIAIATLLLFALLTGCEKPTDSVIGSITITSNPSGAEIFLNGKSTGRTTPATVNLDGGKCTIRLMLKNYFPEDTTCDVAKNGTTKLLICMKESPKQKIAYTSGDTIWVVGLDGISPTKISTNFHPTNGGLVHSPDGQYLTYMSATGVVVLGKNGIQKIVLPLDPYARANDFSWSHSSRYLIVGSYALIGGGIYQYDAVSNNFKRIHQCDDNTYDHNPVFSPGDSLIAFAHHFYGECAVLCLMSPDGSNERRYYNKALTTSYDENINLSWVSETEILCKTFYSWWGVNYGGVFLFDLKTIADSSAKLKPIIDNPAKLLRVSPNRSLYAYSSIQNELYYGPVGIWEPIGLSKYVGLNHFAWAPSNDAIACRTNDGIHWVLLDGTDYHIVDDPTTAPGAVSVAP